jgi:hypothetical protein
MEDGNILASFTNAIDAAISLYKRKEESWILQLTSPCMVIKASLQNFNSI